MNHVSNYTTGETQRIPLSDEIKQQVHESMAKEKGVQTGPNIESMMNNIPPEQHQEVKPTVPAMSSQQQELNSAIADEWEEPLMFDDTKLPPFDTSIFPPHIRKYVEELAEETQTPVDLPAMSVLTVLSAVTAGKFSVHVRGKWWEPLNLYTVYAMPPSSRKSPVYSAVTEHLRAYQNNKRDLLAPEVRRMRSDIYMKKSRIDKLTKDYSRNPKEETKSEIETLNEEVNSLNERAVLPTYIIGGNATPERTIDLMKENGERLAIISPEGGDLFGILSGRYSDKPEIEGFLSAWPGETVTVQRMKRQTSMEHPLLTIGLFVQDDVIKTSDRAFKSRGLLQRFLYCVPESNVGHREIRPKTMAAETDNAYKATVNKLLDYDPKEETELTLSKAADREFKDLQSLNERELADHDADRYFIEWKGKAMSQIIRIAAILHVIEHFKGSQTPEKIDADTFHKAAGLYPYLSAHAAKAFDISDSQDDQTDEHKLYEFIIELQENGKVNRRFIQNKKRYFRGKKGRLKIDEAALSLSQRNIIKVISEGNKTIYEISPYILKSLKNGYNGYSKPSALEPQGIAAYPVKDTTGYSGYSNQHKNKNKSKNVSTVPTRIQATDTPRALEPQGIQPNVSDVSTFSGLKSEKGNQSDKNSNDEGWTI